MKTKSMKMKVTLAMSALALATGSLAQAAGTGFDVNDLNILFATDATGKLVPEIPVDDRILAPSLFQDVQTEATKLGIGTPAQNDQEKTAVMAPTLNFHVGSDKKQWRVISLRYDSCFPAVPKDDADTTNCIEHVRLITQPISPRKLSGEDTTMHLLFAVQGLVKGPAGTLVPQPGKALKAGEERATNTVIGQLAALKAAAKAAGVDTNGAPLGVHPALATPATQAAFAQLVQAFIARNCTTDKLMVITYMGLQGRGPEPWIFFGGNANTTAAGMGRWSVDFQPTTGPQTIPQSGQPLPGSDAIVFSNINQPNVDGKTGKVMPHPHVAFNADRTPLEGSETNISALFDKAPASIVQADLDTANLLENPKVHAPHNTDCFSCHATNTQARSKNIAPTADARTFLVKDGVTAYIERDTQPSTSWNTRNFGYFGGKPSVSYLAAQSAGDVVNFTNRQLTLTNPGITCGTPAKQIALRTCTMFGGAGGAPQTFAQCAQAQGCTK